MCQLRMLEVSDLEVSVEQRFAPDDDEIQVLIQALEEVSRALAEENFPWSVRRRRDTGAQDSAGDSPPTTPGVADQSGGERSDSQ